MQIMSTIHITSTTLFLPCINALQNYASVLITHLTGAISQPSKHVEKLSSQALYETCSHSALLHVQVMAWLSTSCKRQVPLSFRNWLKTDSDNVTSLSEHTFSWLLYPICPRNFSRLRRLWDRLSRAWSIHSKEQRSRKLTSTEWIDLSPLTFSNSDPSASCSSRMLEKFWHGPSVLV